MSKRPTVLIMGRPNVGKSTLLNRIIGKRQAIVVDTPGVTRDLAHYKCDWNGNSFVLIDSGGIFLSKVGGMHLQDEIEARVKNAILKANVVLFVVDSKTGLLEQDRVVAKFLHQQGVKVVLAVNKMDNPERVYDVAPFSGLGFGEPQSISAALGLGLNELMEKLIESLGAIPVQDETERPLRIALIGRPNVGKSSILNSLFNEDRVIVDENAGTTRDSLEFDIQVDNETFTIIDTAGIRKNKKVMDEIEYFSVLRSSDTIASADVVVVVVDATRYFEDQDKKIINLVMDAGKNLIVFVNKWDLTPRTDQVRKDLLHIATQYMPTLEYFPFVFGSANTRHQIFKIFATAKEIHIASQKRLSTATVNGFLDKVMRRFPPPSKQGRIFKIFYATQTDTAPPTFVFFVNNVRLISDSYTRFVERHLREFCGGLTGSPVRIYFRPRRKELE